VAVAASGRLAACGLQLHPAALAACGRELGTLIVCKYTDLQCQK
jgi:hypothetical protein